MVGKWPSLCRQVPPVQGGSKHLGDLPEQDQAALGMERTVAAEWR